MAPYPSLMAGALCVLAVSTLVAFGMHTGDQDKPELNAASALEKQDAVAGAEPPAPKEKKHHETEKEHHAEEASQKMQKHHEEALAKRAASPKTEQKVKALKKKEEKEEKKDAVFVLTKKGAAGYNRKFGGSVKAGDTLAEEHLETAGMSMEDAVRGGLVQAKEEDEASSNPSLVEEKEEDQEAWGFGGGKTTPRPPLKAGPDKDTRDDAVDDLDKSALDQGVAPEKDGKIPPGMATSGCEGENKTCCNAEACSAGNVLKIGVEEGSTATPCKQAQCTPHNDDHTCCESKDRANKRESKATSTTPEPGKSLDKTNKGKR